MTDDKEQLVTDDGDPRGSDASAGDLLRQLAEQTSTLVRQEMELARVELTQKGKQAGLAAGMFGGAGLVGLYAAGALVAAAILALSTAVAGWLAALIVAVVLGAVAGVLAIVGRGRLRAATPPVPEQMVDTVKQDVRYVKERAQEGRR
jgi:MFS family permease